MQVNLVSMAEAQIQVTKQTADNVLQFLDYCTTHPDEFIRYHGRNMILQGHINASYLSKYKSRSRAERPFYMGLRNCNNTQETNESVLMGSIIMKMVMPSVSEAEIGALF